MSVTERQEARERGFRSIQELAQHRVTIKKQLRNHGQTYDKKASTSTLENQLRRIQP